MKKKEGFPSSVYESSWKLFRRLSNENRVTAEVIVSRSNWPRDHSLRILDIGCGDGLLTREIVEDTGQKIDLVTLLDPYIEWLSEAKKNLGDLTASGAIAEIEVKNRRIEDCLPGIYDGHTAILAVHVVYLMEKKAFPLMLDVLPREIPLYLVMDSPGSVFSRIWKHTQPMYLDRVESARHFVKSLENEPGWIVEKSTITSKIENPWELHDHLRDAILSILSYTDYRSLGHDEIEIINREIKKSLVRGNLLCESDCYEIRRLNNRKS